MEVVQVRGFVYISPWVDAAEGSNLSPGIECDIPSMKKNPKRR
jgi:hypothetical protein